MLQVAQVAFQAKLIALTLCYGMSHMHSWLVTTLLVNEPPCVVHYHKLWHVKFVSPHVKHYCNP